MSVHEIKVFSGNANPEFAAKVSECLGYKLAAAKLSKFADGENHVALEESVRGSDVYVIQPTCKPVNDNLMELLIMVDALRRAAAHRINLVIPYFGYARQDRKTQPRDSITAKLVSTLIETAGADRVLTVDLHAGQIQGFFDIPVDNLTGVPLLASYFKEKLKEEIEAGQVAIVSPDMGGVVRARKFVEKLDNKPELAIVDKRRSYTKENFSEAMAVIGNVEGKICIIVDDMVDTAGTLVKAAKKLIDSGATEVYACATHGVLSRTDTKDAIKTVNDSVIKELVITDTIPLTEDKKCEKIRVVSIAPLFADAIKRNHTDDSVSELFK